MTTITTIGIDLQRRCSKSTASMLRARSSSPGSSDARRCWRSSPSWRRVWSAWRPAAVRIIGREIAKPGHSVKLMPPKYVKAYVKRGKTDAGDAAAICEAVTRPSMSFVRVKGLEQQGLSMLHSVVGLIGKLRFSRSVPEPGRVSSRLHCGSSSVGNQDRPLWSLGIGAHWARHAWGITLGLLLKEKPFLFTGFGWRTKGIRTPYGAPQY
jgi:hypothetical protein